MTLEVGLHGLVMGENGCRESGKILGWVTRGGESESDVGVMKGCNNGEVSELINCMDF